MRKTRQNIIAVALAIHIGICIALIGGMAMRWLVFLITGV